MDYKLMMLAAVAVAVIGITSADDKAKVEKCQVCDGTAALCEKTKEETCAAEKKGACKKTVTYKSDAKKEVIGVTRSCEATCTEDKTKTTEVYCCTSDNCNGVASISAGITTVALTVVALFCKNLF